MKIIQITKVLKTFVISAVVGVSHQQHCWPKDQQWLSSVSEN